MNWFKSDRWIPWTFVGGFAVILLANGIMVFSALSSWNGVSTNDPYRRGLGFNKELAARQRTRDLAWQIAAKITKSGERNILTLSLRDKNGRPIPSASVKANFRRPIEKGLDFSVAVKPTGHGRYKASVNLKRPGQWQVDFHILSKGNQVVASRRFVISQ